MKRALSILAVLVLILAAYVGAYIVVNQSVAAAPSDIARAPAADLPAAGETLDLLIWNVGYGGLGEESDFVADGGKNYFPPSREIVRGNVEGIRGFLGGESAEIILIQELARGGPANLWHDLKRAVDAALAGRDRLFYADFRTRLMPWPLRSVHGQGVYSARRVESVDLVPLPAEDSAIMGVRRRYGAVVARLPIEGRDAGWTIVSLHLAAFDEDAAVRTRQLRELLGWARREYESGRHVVLGGDFNLVLAETNFPHTTEERFLFWVHPFPQDALPEGWRIAADPRTPSVRTNERPYRAGENYTAVIDGFIVSPNVVVEHIETVDLRFAHADHQPVRLRVRAAQ